MAPDEQSIHERMRDFVQAIERETGITILGVSVSWLQINAIADAPSHIVEHVRMETASHGPR